MFVLFNNVLHRAVRGCVSEKAIFELSFELRKGARLVYTVRRRDNKHRGPGLRTFASI